ncbi:hypothetical protein ACFYTQ_04925 [Nocardia sp. NPDC004068]|uniref:hypothetical protein n=1 Tax=Nocardia sp. NPDC004068 TaxID=3364303 RepID=UPI0036C29786
MTRTDRPGTRLAMGYQTRKGRYECGVCGTVGKMSKAHVPPQCAGNEGAVTRGHWMRTGSTVTLAAPTKAGSGSSASAVHATPLWAGCSILPTLNSPARYGRYGSRR